MDENLFEYAVRMTTAYFYEYAASIDENTWGEERKDLRASLLSDAIREINTAYLLYGGTPSAKAEKMISEMMDILSRG